MSLKNLRSQIAAQEKRNVDLTTSNASLRKSNVELVTQLEELKTRNEDLTTNHANLAEENAKIICQMDCVKDELEKEKAMGASLKSELETAALKVQTIAVDAILSARAKLMREFKRREHSSWDPDEEIQTWEKRAAVLARDADASEDENEEESALPVGSPKPVELGGGSKQVKFDAEAKAAFGDLGEQGPVEPAVSHEDITRD